MTREKFIKKLEESRYSYEIQGNKIVVTYKGNIWLDSLTSLPPGVVFKNGGYVDSNALTSLPPGVEFRNAGIVNLSSLTGDSFYQWKGNIKGIDYKRLLNKMISLGLFDKNKR